MKPRELIDTLKQGCPVTAKLVREIIRVLEAAEYSSESLRYYMAECTRLEDILAAKEEK